MSGVLSRSSFWDRCQLQNKRHYKEIREKIYLKNLKLLQQNVRSSPACFISAWPCLYEALKVIIVAEAVVKAEV